MADIARLAGVSVSTVSRALSGSPLVNAATKQRVAELARSLNYSINVGAQNLRLKQNRTVAVIVPFDPETRQHLSDPFFLAIIGSIADALTDRGYDMLLSRVDANTLDQAAQFHGTGRAVGIILIGQWHHHDQLNQMALRGVPLVVWGAQLSGQIYASVGSHNQIGGEQATAHLLAQGARRIAFLGDPELPEVGLRYAGYLNAHERAGITPDPQLMLPVAFVRESVQAAVRELHARGVPFDAVFAGSDLVAMTTTSTLRSLGVNVPEDVLVAGYDDIELAAHFHPPLTTVRQPIVEAGEALVNCLLSQLAGERPQSVLLPTELVVRESTQTTTA
ncbi:LacI family DNA-binding transcriptional regulator [Ideonella margarita]|uniref:LacI family DNA-binding transcriptional regulator n=1 Tax=Ideonella margarita TaxID=2984191 RepID=A0ABU9C9A3_9BURK